MNKLNLAPGALHNYLLEEAKHYSTDPRVGYSPVKVGKEDHWRLDATVREHVASGGGPTISLFNRVLFGGRMVVTPVVMAFCKAVIAAGITVPMPIPNEGPKARAYFTSLAGPSTISRLNRDLAVPGCYTIKVDKDTYSGQGRSIGHRVATHSRSSAVSGHWLHNRLASAIVILYPLPAPVNGLYCGLTLEDILGIVELYLFVTLAPNINKTYVPGIVSGFQMTEQEREQQAKGLRVPVYVYELDDSLGTTYKLLFMAPATKELGPLVGMHSSLVNNTKRWGQKGWFHNQLLITTELLVPENTTPALSAAEMSARFKAIIAGETIPKPKAVRVTQAVTVIDHLTNITTEYTNKLEACKVLNTDHNRINSVAASGKRFRGRYSFILGEWNE